MKYFLFLFSLFFINHQNPSITTVVSLQQAVDQNLIELDVRGNEDSPHYVQPIMLYARNVTNNPLTINIPNGQQFLSQDPSVQDMLVVKSQQIELPPEHSISLELPAMCTQQDNDSPTDNDLYSIGPMATSHLLQVSDKIEQMESFNTIGQYAVWSISDNLALDRIAGFDEDEAGALQQFVSSITGKAIPEKNTTDYLTNYNRPSLAKVTLGGEFEYRVSKTSEVTIGLFNEQNIIVRELLNQPETPRGDHLFEYQFDLSAYTDPIYYVRLIIDGDIKLSFRIDT